jgi:hypothetical protein
MILPEKPPRRVRFMGQLNRVRRITGYRALYFSYLYKMCVLPKKKQKNPNSVYFLFREDIRFVQKIARETRLLVTHKIDTADQLAAHKNAVAAEMGGLAETRKHLRYKVRNVKDDSALAAIKSEIAALSMKIGALRKEVALCEDIASRSAVMQEKLRKAAEDNKPKGKEVKRHEPFRGRR